MKTLRLAIALLACFLATVLSAPRDRIDPKALKDAVTITLGDKGTVQFKQQDDVLSEPKLVKEADKKAPGLAIESFEKMEPGQIMLMVRNRFPKALHYRAAIRMKGSKEYVETSIIPVMAGLVSAEGWSDPIEEIILFEFKLSDMKP